MLQKLSISLIALISYIGLANAAEFSKNNIYIGGGLGSFTGQKFKEIEDHPYLRGKAKAKPRILYNFFVGYDFNKYLRADINGQYRRYNYNVTQTEDNSTITSKQKIKNLSVFLNGYINVPNRTIFIPYITLGVGCSHNNPSSLKYEETTDPDNNIDAPGKSTNHFAWNAGLGLRIKIYKNVRIDLSYRYADLGRVKVKSSTTKDGDTPVSPASQKLRTHQGLLSLVYYM